jgi:hypothetical protein
VFYLPGYNFSVLTSESPSRLPDVVTLAAAAGGAALLWFYRDVMSVDIALRLMLTAAWLVVWTMAALGAGAPVFRRATGRHRVAPIDLPLALLCGTGVLATLATFLALFGLFRAPILIAILLAAALLGFREGWFWAHAESPRVPLTLPVVGWFLIAVTLSLVPVLGAPPVMYDALNYHLAFPAHWLAAGQFVEFPRHGFSYYPSSYGMLYGYALAAVGPWAATAIHFWFGVLATLAAAGLGARYGGPKTAVWAAACFGLTPVVLEVSTYATADLAVAAWGAASLSVLIPTAGDRLTNGRVALAGFLLGCTLAAKYLAIAVVFLPLVAASIPLVTGLPIRRSAKLISSAAAAASVPLLPWLLRNLVWIGNPLYPYLQGTLGGASTEMSVGVHMMQIGGTEPGSLAWVVRSIFGLGLRTFEPLGQGGIFGPHWLLLLPLAAFVRFHTGDGVLKRSLWLFTIVGLLAWGSLVQMARFLLPVLVVAAPLAGSAAAALVSSERATVRRSFSCLLVFILAWNSTMIATTQNLDRLGVAAGLTDAEDEYMARWISYYPTIRHLNENLPPGSKVLLVGEPRSFYIDPPVVIEDPFRTPLLVELAAGGASAADIFEHLNALGVTHVLFNTHEMGLSARLRGVDDYWTGASPPQRAVIDEFLTEWTVRTAGDSALWVARVTPRSAAVTQTVSP